MAIFGISKMARHGRQPPSWIFTIRKLHIEFDGIMVSCTNHHIAVGLYKAVIYETHRKAVLLHWVCQLVTFRSSAREKAVLTHVEAETLKASIPVHYIHSTSAYIQRRKCINCLHSD